MATSIDNTNCLVCGEEKRIDKRKDCSPYDCSPFSSDGDQTLDKQFEQIQSPEKHQSLSEQISQWENDSIKQIQQIAEEKREMLRKDMIESINELKTELSKFTRDTELIEKENDFDQMDLNKLEAKLKELEQQLNKPSTISIQYDYIPFSRKLVLTTDKNNSKKTYSVIFSFGNTTTITHRESSLSKRPGRDPSLPKRPLSAFWLFSQDQRPELKRKYPNDSVGDIAYKIGKLWTAASDDVKQEYEQKAAVEKQKYEQLLLEYKKKHGEDSLKKDATESSEKHSDDDDKN